MSERASEPAKRWVTYDDWMEQVHTRVREAPIWQNLAYRKALFLYDLAWRDCERMTRDRRGRAIVEQLIRSVGSISANVEEGHGRGSGKQCNWFFTVSVGSARETKGWYWRARKLLSEEVLEHRLALTDEVIALLSHELKRQPSRKGEADH